MTDRQVTFAVEGEPRGKGRPRFSARGGYVTTYTDEKTVEYEQRIGREYKFASNGRRFVGAVKVKIVARYGIPKSTTKTMRQGIQRGNVQPTKKPDLDNVIKAVLDGLNGVAYDDDKQVTAIEAWKEYAERAGLIITISQDERNEQK